MNTIQTIESKDLAIEDLFTSFYSVPDYQREFVWEEKQVEQLLQDIYTEYGSNGHASASEYFIGSIVVCARTDGVLELIDGQQRMTTAFLLFCALRDHVKAFAPKSTLIGMLGAKIAAADVDHEGQDVFRYRVALQYEDSCDVLEVIGKGNEDPEGIAEKTRSVTNILSAYRSIRYFLNEQFGNNEDAVRKFYAYVQKNVKLIRVKTVSVAHALKIFETINDRGVGLDSMDLLKNLMFMHAKRDAFDQLKTKWKDLVDVLFKSEEKPLRFLRYFIFAEFDVDRLKEDEIYEWFIKEEALCGYRKAPLDFVDRLNQAATAYVHFLSGKDRDGRQNRYLVNIEEMSGAARQHLILLLAGRRLPADCFSELCRNVENLFFAYVITREPTREFERKFAQWAGALRTVKDESALSRFLQDKFGPEKERLAARFDLSFREMRAWSLQKYRLKYVLAKLTQYVNVKAWGTEKPWTDIYCFLNKKVHIEHILPQTPGPDALAEFDKPENAGEYIYRLGNLTLAEDTINCSVGNGRYSAKKVEYFKSNFLLTKSLGGDVSVGKDTAVAKVAKKLHLYDRWTSAAVEDRQGMLADLARRTWDMPQVASEQKDA